MISRTNYNHLQTVLTWFFKTQNPKLTYPKKMSWTHLTWMATTAAAHPSSSRPFSQMGRGMTKSKMMMMILIMVSLYGKEK